MPFLPRDDDFFIFSPLARSQDDISVGKASPGAF